MLSMLGVFCSPLRIHSSFSSALYYAQEAELCQMHHLDSPVPWLGLGLASSSGLLPCSSDQSFCF